MRCVPVFISPACFRQPFSGENATARGLEKTAAHAALRQAPAEPGWLVPAGRGKFLAGSASWRSGLVQPTVKCEDYRAGRRLLGLKQRLAQDGLSPEERRRLEAEIAELERELGMD
jgi:hypothetical protein